MMDYDDAQSVKEIYWKKLAAKRLELLRRYDESLQREPDCFSCGVMTYNEDIDKWEHAPDCELAAELGDNEEE